MFTINSKKNVLDLKATVGGKYAKKHFIELLVNSI